MFDKIYVCGHRSPDTDSVCAAIAYAELKQKQTGKPHKPVRAGEINSETSFVLNRFEVKTPELLKDASGKKLILVDHNESQQSPKGIENAEIIEVLDHHKIKFSTEKPIYFHVEPLGSTSTIVARMFFEEKIEISKEIAGIILSAILSDTVIFKSPTTTEEDKNIAQKLAQIAEIPDINAFGIEIKKAKSSFRTVPVKEVIMSDFKEFELSGKKIGIGQIEVVEMVETNERRSEFLKKLEEIRLEENYDLVMLVITDIINEGSEILISGNGEAVKKAFGKKPKNKSVYVKGLMSRKKQVIPVLEKAYSK